VQGRDEQGRRDIASREKGDKVEREKKSRDVVVKDEVSRVEREETKI
jgi:hypothetical protein